MANTRLTICVEPLMPKIQIKGRNITAVMFFWVKPATLSSQVIEISGGHNRD